MFKRGSTRGLISDVYVVTSEKASTS
jgi:hypothetical protein